MSKHVITLLLIIIGNSMIAQNLVNDPSFENYVRCPQNIIQDVKKFPLKYWNIPTGGTTDYFNSCSKKLQTTIPNNSNGNQEARTGNGFVHSLNSINWVEYVQTELKETLNKDEDYYVEFWVSLQENCMRSTNSFGIYFSELELTNIKSSKPLDVKPQIKSDKFVTDTDKWVKISGIFKANGKEQYLILGCFPKSKNDFKVEKKHRKKSAGYYIDDVMVRRVKEDSVVTKQFTSELNKPIILKNITFEFGKSQLKESSFAELNKLAAELNANPSYQISLSGHTDNIGQEEDNLKLSEARAKAVAEYLVSKGIAKERITYKGYGSQQPITTNETEQGREQNRRVEFILTQDAK